MKGAPMRRLLVLWVCLAAACVSLPAQATTVDLYMLNLDENGNGTYAEYSPPAVDPGNLIASGLLPWTAIGGGGITYTLPYTINIQSYSQWLGIYDERRTDPSPTSSTSKTSMAAP